MNPSDLMRLGISHSRNALAEWLYLQGVADLTRPITFHALVNERCNSRCRHCEYWRMERYCAEMGIEDWKRVLISIREFTGPFSISFSGGEPFLKKGFVDLLRFCRDNGIHAGVTTNGMLISEKNAAEIVAARPFNINISCDGHTAAIHDPIRGREGSFDKVVQALRLLRREQEAQRIEFPVIIKPTIMSQNFRILHQLVEWAVRSGASAVNFQPLGRWSKETDGELWIGKDQQPELDQMMDTLIGMKRSGAPILNSEEMLRLVTKSFREEKASPEHLPCRIGLQEFYIRPDGEVRLCMHFPAVGNIARQTAKEIWMGTEASKIRTATIRCDKLCLLTCLSHKSIGNRIGQALTLLGRQNGRKCPAIDQTAYG